MDEQETPRSRTQEAAWSYFTGRSNGPTRPDEERDSRSFIGFEGDAREDDRQVLELQLANHRRFLADYAPDGDSPVIHEVKRRIAEIEALLDER